MKILGMDLVASTCPLLPLSPSLTTDLTTQSASPENEFETFTVYFLAFDHGTPTTPENRFTREGILEPTRNHGTAESFQGHASGNADPGCGFQKKLTDGKMKHIAFILDPDGCVPLSPRLVLAFNVCHMLSRD